MAKVFENDPDVHVAGIVLIESIYPKLIRTHYPRVDRLDLAYDKDFRNDVRDRIFRNLDQSIQAAQSYIVDPQQEMPPTVLIRADSVMPSLEGVEYPDMLGWDEDGHDFVKHVYNVPGHHFSIFLQENVGAKAERSSPWTIAIADHKSTGPETDGELVGGLHHARKWGLELTHQRYRSSKMRQVY